MWNESLTKQELLTFFSLSFCFAIIRNGNIHETCFDSLMTHNSELSKASTHSENTFEFLIIYKHHLWHIQLLTSRYSGTRTEKCFFFYYFLEENVENKI